MYKFSMTGSGTKGGCTVNMINKEKRHLLKCMEKKSQKKIKKKEKKKIKKKRFILSATGA